MIDVHAGDVIVHSCFDMPFEAVANNSARQSQTRGKILRYVCHEGESSD